MGKEIKDWDVFRKSFLKNNLRRISWKWPATRQVVVAARTERKINPATGKLCWHVKCALCNKEFLEREVQVDHIEPVIPVQGLQGSLGVWNSAIATGQFVLRMLPEPTGLRCLCAECHSSHTANQNTARREIRRIVREVSGGTKPRTRTGRKEE